MKYWNKGKERRENWTVIIVYTRHAEAKRWCQNYPSKSKFYASQYSNIWYFENSEDALVFSLVWMGKNE